MPDSTGESDIIDFNKPVLDINDKPLKGDEDKDLRLGDVCCNALMATLRDDKADGVQRLKRFNLARKIKGEDEDDFAVVMLNSKQKKLILDMAEKAFSGALIYARVYEALEGTTDDKETD